jgi:hypothetical protein
MTTQANIMVSSQPIDYGYNTLLVYNIFQILELMVMIQEDGSNSI